MFPVVLLLLLLRAESTSVCTEDTVADIVFLVDGSWSIGSENFQCVREFLHGLVDGFDVAPDRVRIGMVQYSSTQRNEFSLNTYQNKTDILEYVDKLPYMTGSTMTGLGLDFILKKQFVESAGSRAKDNVPQIAVVITDGESADDVGPHAENLKKQGITLYAIGVKNADEKQLKEIASAPPDQHMFSVSDFTALQNITQKILKEVCTTANQTKPTEPTEPPPGSPSGPLCSDQSLATISYRNESGFRVNTSNCELNITDRLGSFSCQSNGHVCYAQCSRGNTSLVNLTSSYDVCFLDNCKRFYFPESNVSCFTTLCTKEEISKLLQEFDNPNATIEDLKRILNVKRICRHIFNDTELVKIYIYAEYSIIHNVIRDTSINASAVEHDLGEMLMTITGANCSSHNNIINATSQMMVPGLIPVETLIPLEAFQNVSADKRKAAVIHYTSPQQFTVSQDVDVVSSVVRVELVDKPTTPLTTQLTMTFTVDGRHWEVNSTDNFSCQYYDEFTDSKLQWSSRGCEMAVLDAEDRGSMLVQCQCDHMTPFAVLLIPGLEEELGEHWTILSYLSYIGCGLSAFFCGIAIFSYFILRKVWKDTSAEIHISLSGALLLLNCTFLLNEWAAGRGAACVCVAVAIEYALLAAFTWMAIEALHLYLMLIRVFNVYYARYMLKLSLIGWGVPAVVVGVSMVVRLDDGSLAYGLVDNQDSGYCWIREPVFAYGLNLTFFSLVFLLNSGVLVTVSWRILRMRPGAGPGAGGKGAGPGQGSSLSCGSVLTVLGLTCLLGSCWGLAFLSYGHTNIVILYLFCILNSLQGFFLFLWVYGTGRKRRREQQQATNSSSVQDSFSTKTQDHLYPVAHHHS